MNWLTWMATWRRGVERDQIRARIGGGGAMAIKVAQFRPYVTKKFAPKVAKNWKNGLK